MRVKTHIRFTGYLVMNLQALETTVRAFLECRDGRPLTFPRPGDTVADETWLTKRSYFGPLVDEYNESLNTPKEQELYVLDLQVVGIRNAFAHGRLFTDFERLPARLWKFEKSGIPGKVDVDFSQLLTPEWLLKNHNFILREKQKVLSCFKSRGYKGLK